MYVYMHTKLYTLYILIEHKMLEKKQLIFSELTGVQIIHIINLSSLHSHHLNEPLFLHHLHEPLFAHHLNEPLFVHDLPPYHQLFICLFLFI